MKKVSLVMIVKDEEKHIKQCLESAKASVDEIIVIDTGSSDQTKTIAENCGAVIYDFTWVDDFSAARNFGLSKASGEWILVLDADEFLEKNYRDTIQHYISEENRIGKIAIRSKFEHNGQVQESITYISRLFPKGNTYEGRIHEQLKSDLPRVNIPIEVLHEGYYLTDKTERNISLLEKELSIHPHDAYYLYQLAREYRSRKEYEKANEYFHKSYSLLTKDESFAPNVIIDYLNNLIQSKDYAEALELAEKEEVFLEDYPDLYFSKGVLLTHSLSSATIEDFKKIETAYLRCLDLGDSGKSGSVIGTGSFLASYNLGVLYELLGLRERAIHFYESAERSGYKPAQSRLHLLQQ